MMNCKLGHCKKKLKSMVQGGIQELENTKKNIILFFLFHIFASEKFPHGNVFVDGNVVVEFCVSSINISFI